MDHTELILMLDKQQSIYNTRAVVCARDEAHGRLLPMRDGATLICCKCGYLAAASIVSDAE